MPVGAPSRYRTEFAMQALKLCQMGATDVQLADFFGVSTQTIYTWASQHPKFLDSIKVGKDEVDERVVKSLYHRAMGYSVDTEKLFCLKDGTIVRAQTREHYPPDVTACIFWLKNRKRASWNDKSEIEVNWKGLQLFQINYNGNGKPELPTGAGLTRELVGSTNPPDEAGKTQPLLTIGEGDPNSEKG